MNKIYTPEASFELILTTNQISQFHSAILIFNLIGRMRQYDSDMCFSVWILGKWPIQAIQLIVIYNGVKEEYSDDLKTCSALFILEDVNKPLRFY